MKREDYFNSGKVNTSLDPMSEDLIVPRGSKGSRIENSPFRRIPAITKFIVKPGEYNHLLAGSGLERKLKAEVEYELDKVQNKINKSLAKEIRRLKNALRNGKTDFYWQRAEYLMKNSAALRLSAMNTVLKGWYKNRDYQNIIDTAFKVERILSKDIVNLKYFRVEIPKGSPEDILKWFSENPDKAWPGPMRPLGVPTASWRVVLHMWNGFLTMFLENELKEFNHAYMPRVGTVTALKDLVLKVLNKAYIYEFDIKGFFNNVSILDTIRKLRERGMNKEMRLRLKRILDSWPANIEAVTSVRGQDTTYDQKLGHRKYLNESKVLSNVSDNIVSSLIYTGNLSALLAIDKGLPQGAAPSTILSLLALADWFKELKKKGIKLLMYADDGLLYSDEPFEPYPPKGFEFAENKSKWVKQGAPSLSDELKFLGVKYNFRTQMLKGATRNGSTLEFGKDQRNVLDLLKELQPSEHSCSEMPALVQSSIFGLALSKLYGGKFGTLRFKEKQTFDEKSYWAKYHNLESLKKSKMEQRLASTVACGWLKIVIKHSMGKISRSKMHADIREYHSEEHINWEDLAAAHDWQEIWNHEKD